MLRLCVIATMALAMAALAPGTWAHCGTCGVEAADTSVPSTAPSSCPFIAGQSNCPVTAACPVSGEACEVPKAACAGANCATCPASGEACAAPAVACTGQADCACPHCAASEAPATVACTGQADCACPHCAPAGDSTME